MSTLTTADHIEIQQFIQRTASLLDAEKLNDWLALFDAEGKYEISAYSSELRRPLVWWRSEYGELEKMLHEVKKHVRDPASRLRILGQSLIDANQATVSVSTAFSVYRTTTDGTTSLYVVGVYEDTIVRLEEQWRYRSHHVRLSTRVLEAFTHLPL